MNKTKLFTLIIFLMAACTSAPTTEDSSAKADMSAIDSLVRPEVYAPFRLETDVSQLTDAEKQMIPLLIKAADIMDGLFWQQAYGDKSSLMSQLEDSDAKKFAEINYGPWDRLAGNRPFITGVGEKPAGSNLYPADITKKEFEAFDAPDKNSLYTLIRRAEDGSLQTVPYSKIFAPELQKAAQLLKEAAVLAEDEGLKKHLNLRAEALVDNRYRESDMAWMDMTSNGIDVIIGPIETYEDQLYGYKAAFEAYVLVKDKKWTKRLEKYAAMLPELQEQLPVEEVYKAETPGRDSQLGAYDVIYYAGDCNAGSKTIAVNLPNDEKVQLEKGTRRLQLKNAMRAKFDKIMLPITDVLIDESQRQHVTFDAFFGNTMFHEVAHGLGIKNTIDGKGTVRQALKDQASALEEGKADILGLYMVTKLFEKGEIEEGVIMDNYVTFMAGIFRSVRFGASSAHGKANMLRFNYFQEMDAFTRNEAAGTYKIDFDKMQEAMNKLSAEILKLQGDGDYEGVKALMEEKGAVPSELMADLQRLKEAGIPVDIEFEQGVDVLGL